MSNLNLIQNKMNLTYKNLSLISDNFANMNTPGYQRRYVDVQGQSFRSALETDLRKTRDKHITGAHTSFGAEKKEEYSVRTDNNGVSIDKEVLEMQKNKMFYNSLVNMVNGEFSKAKTIITSK